MLKTIPNHLEAGIRLILVFNCSLSFLCIQILNLKMLGIWSVVLQQIFCKMSNQTSKTNFIFIIIQGLLSVRCSSKENQSGATSSGMSATSSDVSGFSVYL